MTTTIRSSADGSKSYIQVGGTDVVTLGTQGIEAGSFKPGAIAANDLADGALIENSANGIGYGLGAGGTVTQATSKFTAVTLNKPCGVITMHNAALASGASVAFQVNNSLVSSNADVITVCGLWTVVDPISYRVEATRISSGSFTIRVTNITAGSLSEALVITFALTKGTSS